MGNFNPCAVRSRDAGFDLPCISTCEYCEEEIDPYVSIPEEVQAELDRLRKVEAAARVVVDLDEPIAYGGAMWELREALGDEQ